jgi:hypothetical protein
VPGSAGNASCSSTDVCTPGLVRESIKRIKIESERGLDCVPTIFCAKCSLWLCQPFTLVCQSSFDQRYLPPAWLQFFITPVFKTDDTFDPVNYIVTDPHPCLT